MNETEHEIGYAEDTPLDLSILDEDENVYQYIYSLLKNSEQFYTAIKTGTYDKVLISNTEKIYQYHKDIDCFYISELPINSEEDYIVLDLVDVVEGKIPVFRIRTTQVELGTLEYLYNIYIKYPYYSLKWKREFKNAV